MSGTEEEVTAGPLVEPRLLKFLKERPRLVDRGVRKEILEELEQQARMRREPGNVAESAVDKALARFREATGPVAKNKATKAAEKANDGPLNRL